MVIKPGVVVSAVLVLQEGNTSTPGKRSLTMPLNRGTSWLRNLQRLTLMMELSISTNSSSLGNLCFRLAAGRHNTAQRNCCLHPTT